MSSPASGCEPSQAKPGRDNGLLVALAQPVGLKSQSQAVRPQLFSDRELQSWVRVTYTSNLNLECPLLSLFITSLSSAHQSTLALPVMIALFIFFFSPNACTIYSFKACPPTTYHVYSMLIDYSFISHFSALKCLH